MKQGQDFRSAGNIHKGVETETNLLNAIIVKFSPAFNALLFSLKYFPRSYIPKCVYGDDHRRERRKGQNVGSF